MKHTTGGCKKYYVDQHKSISRDSQYIYDDLLDLEAGRKPKERDANWSDIAIFHHHRIFEFELS